MDDTQSDRCTLYRLRFAALVVRLRAVLWQERAADQEDALDCPIAEGRFAGEPAEAVYTSHETPTVPP